MSLSINCLSRSRWSKGTPCLFQQPANESSHGRRRARNRRASSWLTKLNPTRPRYPQPGMKYCNTERYVPSDLATAPFPRKPCQTADESVGSHGRERKSKRKEKSNVHHLNKQIRSPFLLAVFRKLLQRSVGSQIIIRDLYPTKSFRRRLVTQEG